MDFFLKDKRMDPNAKHPEFGCAQAVAVAVACLTPTSDSFAMLQNLVEYGADMNARDPIHGTPFDAALRAQNSLAAADEDKFNSFHVLEALEKHGATAPDLADGDVSLEKFLDDEFCRGMLAFLAKRLYMFSSSPIAKEDKDSPEAYSNPMASDPIGVHSWIEKTYRSSESFTTHLCYSLQQNNDVAGVIRRIVTKIMNGFIPINKILDDIDFGRVLFAREVARAMAYIASNLESGNFFSSGHTLGIYQSFIRNYSLWLEFLQITKSLTEGDTTGLDAPCKYSSDGMVGKVSNYKYSNPVNDCRWGTIIERPIEMEDYLRVVEQISAKIRANALLVESEFQKVYRTTAQNSNPMDVMDFPKVPLVMVTSFE
ncbi:hypothetical protein BDD12DRAFT_984895 [Trichophaea hybrida]|nr:hypothetical protein BDD12DRAFT_984895 [Trichophaea hybrida]